MKTVAYIFSLLGLATVAVAAPHRPVIDRINDLELYELDESGDYDSQEMGVVYQQSPVPYDAVVRHYRQTLFTARADGATFYVYASFEDSEDGGNTYGWITDGAGDLIASIADSGIMALDGRHLDDWDNQHNFGELPLAIDALDLSDAAATRAFITKMVETQEGLVENPASNGDDHLDVELTADAQPCQVLGGRTLALCHVSYLQDRWNGTLTLWIAIENGQGVAVVQAIADGHH